MAEIQGLERELAAAQAEIQRVEWNRAIRAAAKVAQESWTRADLSPSQTARIAGKILKLVR
jgi:hypothetical protein